MLPPRLPLACCHVIAFFMLPDMTPIADATRVFAAMLPAC